jgi:hypothetical protein
VEFFACFREENLRPRATGRPAYIIRYRGCCRSLRAAAGPWIDRVRGATVVVASAASKLVGSLVRPHAQRQGWWRSSVRQL